jgi:hypothetical protein
MTQETSMPTPTTHRPKMADVLDVPHDLYVGDRLVISGLTTDRVRTNVRNANYKQLDMRQEPDGTIRIQTRRYVPQKTTAA